MALMEVLSAAAEGSERSVPLKGSLQMQAGYGNYMRTLYLCVQDSISFLQWLREDSHRVALIVRYCCWPFIKKAPPKVSRWRSVKATLKDEMGLATFSHDSHSFCTRALNLLYALSYDPDLIGHQHVVDAVAAMIEVEGQPKFSGAQPVQSMVAMLRGA